MMQMADPNGEAASAEFILVCMPTHANDCLAKYVYVSISSVIFCLRPFCLLFSSIASENDKLMGFYYFVEV